MYNDVEPGFQRVQERVASVALDDKYDRLQQLMHTGKEKGYVLYDEVSELLPAELNNGTELDDLLVGLDGAGIEILEEPKIEKLEETEELLDLELPPGIGEKIKGALGSSKEEGNA